MASSAKDIQLGIIGGGQLGKMLLQQAANYPVRPQVLSQYAEGPCRPYCHHYHTGSLTDEQTVFDFGQRVEVLTVEIEQVHTGALKRLEEAGVSVFPQPGVLEVVKDKGLQKQFYTRHGIPTAPFHLVKNKAEVQEHRAFFPAVQKLRQGGYDGRGVHMINTPSDMEAGFDISSILEQRIDVATELAVIVSRDKDGTMATFPPVELVFHPREHLVDYLFTPASVSVSVSATAEKIACQVADALGIIGILAVELFVDKQGQVLVNEIAPRPHNSGHHTIEANYSSQYDQHLRTILGFPAGDTGLRQPAAMMNLLGEPGHEGPTRYVGLHTVLGNKTIYVHLYGKQQTRPYRKMGHITALAETAEAAVDKARRAREKLKVIT